MTPEEVNLILSDFAPGETERILRDNIISPSEYRRFQKRQAELVQERLYPITPTSGKDQ